MVTRPAAIKDMGEAEVAVGRCCRRQTLPGFQLVPGTAKHYHPGHLALLGKTRGGGRSVGTSRENHLIPQQVTSVPGQELFPFTLGIFFPQAT